MIKILSVVGARPNFIKIAPLHKEFKKHPGIENYICHTGQHFDSKMSHVFFDELEMPRPDYYLGISGGSHATQTSGIMTEFEKVVLSLKPDLIVVPGDVNSTMAAALVGSKIGIRIAHVESGLRSFDRSMPEEINRIVTDVVSDLLFVSEESGLQNLKNEGVQNSKIHFVGNIMIDSLIQYLPKIEKSEIAMNLGVRNEKYCLCTFHRPSNVDSEENLFKIVTLLNDLSDHIRIIFPMHPRTRIKYEQLKNRLRVNDRLIITDPVGYIDFLNLVKNSELVITDSGGIQEETTYMNVQCITVRENTERPVTVEKGTNQLVGTDTARVKEAAFQVLSGTRKTGTIPELWDGNTASRIVSIIKKSFNLS